MSLQDRLDTFKADFENGRFALKPSKEALGTMRRATDALIASGQAERALKAGDLAPDLTLSDPDGNVVSSRRLLSKGPLVISFYRGIWCPYCNLELQALEEILPEIRARGANLVAISPQTGPYSRKSVRENKLTFPILSDTMSEVADAFGIRFSLPDDLVELYLTFKTDLSAFNNDASWVLPMPARYVVGTDGIIVYAEVNPDYTRRPDPSELLPALDALRRSAAA